MAQQQTETGIDISNYAADKAAGLGRIIKPTPTSQNYLYVKSTFTAQIVNGVPTAVEGAPELRNINRQSLIDLEAQLVAQETAIANARTQIAAIRADMNALDVVQIA